MCACAFLAAACVATTVQVVTKVNPVEVVTNPADVTTEVLVIPRFCSYICSSGFIVIVPLVLYMYPWAVAGDISVSSLWKFPALVCVLVLVEGGGEECAGGDVADTFRECIGELCIST